MKAVYALVALATAAICSAQDIRVQVDGSAVTFPDAQPQYVDGRVLVPLRGVLEQMGARVNWDQQTRTVTAHREGSNVSLRIGDHVASINGSQVNLDVPAMVIQGSTMVPIRFVSEALGAQVGWLEAERLVTITTNTAGNSSIVTQPRRLRRIIARTDQVIPVELNQTLSTADNRRGDTFTATVRRSHYGDIPEGTTIEGHIAAIHPKRGDRPAILDLAFDRMRFPDGRAVRLDATLTSLDDQHVRQSQNGAYVARRSNGAQDQRMVYAGYGAGAGLLVGVLTKRPLEDTVLGGVLGYIAGQVDHDQRQRQSRNITLRSGTEMGVRIQRDIAMTE